MPLRFPVCRLGLASCGRTVTIPDDVLSGIGRGVNFLNWQGLAEGPAAGDAFSTAISPEELIQGVHDNLRNLGLDAIDVVNYRHMGAALAPRKAP